MPNTTRRQFMSMCCGLIAAGATTRAIGSLTRPRAAVAALTPIKTSHLNTEKAKTVRMMVTAYCPCKICCGRNAHGVTASGKSVTENDGKFVAADTNFLPFGTLVSVPGYNDGQPVEVLDRGGAIKGGHIDVFFPTHDQARRWGVRYVDVTIVG